MEVEEYVNGEMTCKVNLETGTLLMGILTELASGRPVELDKESAERISKVKFVRTR